MAKQRRRDAALIAQAAEGDQMLAELADAAERDAKAIPYLRKLVAVLLEARGLSTAQ